MTLLKRHSGHLSISDRPSRHASVAIELDNQKSITMKCHMTDATLLVTIVKATTNNQNSNHEQHPAANFTQTISLPLAAS